MHSSKPGHMNPESRIEINITFQDEDGRQYRVENERTYFEKKISTSSPRPPNYSSEIEGSTSHEVTSIGKNRDVCKAAC